MTERTRLPDRRLSVTQHVVHELSSGNQVKIIVTFSFNELGLVREFFCADFKAGSDQQALIIDASILVSRLLQHGVTPRMLLGSLSEPTSIIGSILKVAAELDEEKK